MVDLSELFDIQKALNLRCGFNTDDLFLENGEIDPILVGVWIDNFLKGMSSEMEELRDCTAWKHWYKEAREGKRYMVKDIEEARKEVIDMLFFWMSLAQVVGLGSLDVANRYREKAGINHKRQDDDCDSNEAKGYVR